MKRKGERRINAVSSGFKTKNSRSRESAKILNWGLKKLAYPIQKKSTGFYNLIEFTAESGELIADLELAFKRDEKILRFLTVKLDKHAQAWAVERRKRMKAEKA